ncbi:hypothetical protein [Aeromicrobium sp. 179-A 4D2 NHS]|uniref:hypothetical protein n=1 Tax=Aeromicrobium sp. 179-A 4D2 NHS TaxID=3142375 RepID=UPI0039A00112
MNDVWIIAFTCVLGFAATAQAAVMLGTDRRESGLYGDRTAIAVPALLIIALALFTPGVVSGYLTPCVGFGATAVYAVRFLYRTVRGPSNSNF